MQSMEQAEQLFLKQSNLYRAQQLMDSEIRSAATSGASVILGEPLLKRFHKITMQGLISKAGEYREDNVIIKNSPHIPPSWLDVPAAMGSFFRYIEKNWETQSLTHLAAFVMWRINWIHPFTDGNGRTSRTSAYFVLCAKNGSLFPAKNSVLEQLTNPEVKAHYYAALRNCDELISREPSIDLVACVRPLERVITKLLKEQLQSNINLVKAR